MGKVKEEYLNNLELTWDEKKIKKVLGNREIYGIMSRVVSDNNSPRRGEGDRDV